MGRASRRSSTSVPRPILRAGPCPKADSTFLLVRCPLCTLQVALGDIKVPLRGKLLKDGPETVRMRIGEGWDVDIYKAMILAVEEDSMISLPA